MSQLPSVVSMDADPSDDGDGQAAGQSQHPEQGNRSSNNQRLTRPVPREIRSVDSGYSETSMAYQASLSPDAVPSNPPSLNSVDLNQPLTSASPPSGQLRSGRGQPFSNPYSTSPSEASQYGSGQFGSSVDAVSDIREHLVHRINRAVGKDKKVEEENNSSSIPQPPIISSFSSSSSSSSIPSASSSSSSVPIDDADSVSDADIEALKKEMPITMRVDFQDAMVLYCDEDRDKVELFMENFEGMKLFDRIIPKVMLYDDMAVAIGSPIKALEFGIDRCTYVFLYITKLFCGDTWSEFSSETCLMEAIHNPEKKWCVVPVFTEPKRSASFRVPPSLNSLKGIQYWTNDKFFKDSVKKLLEEKLFIRRKNEKTLLKERKEWVVSHRVKKMKEEVQEREEKIALQRKEQRAREETQAQIEELRRRELEQNFLHQVELQKIQQEQQRSQEMALMMQHFKEKFNVQTSSTNPGISQPGLTSSKSDGELFQYLLQMSGLQQNVFAPCNPIPSNVHQVSLAQGNSLASGRSFQETSGPQASDEGSTGFSISHMTGSTPGSNSQNTQYFSLPSQSVQGSSVAFQSLPSNIQTGTAPLDSETCSRSDLEEDQPPSLCHHTGASASHPQGHQSVPDARTFSGAQSIGVGLGAQARPVPVPDPPANAKEIHYHYHIYDKKAEKSDTKTASEQLPINIVGAKIVQIGDGNLVRVDEEFMKGEEQRPVVGGDSDSEGQEVLEHKHTPQPGTASKPVASIPSQPPSTIYQDNNPSVTSRPVQLPTRHKEQGQKPAASRSAADSGNPAHPSTSAAVLPQGSGTLLQGTVPKASVATIPKGIAHQTAVTAAPEDGSVDPRTPNTAQANLQGQVSMVPPISSGPMAGLSSEASGSSSHPGGPQIALVKPMGAPDLLQRGCDETTVKGVAPQASSSVPPQTEYDSMLSQTVLKGVVEERDPCLEQTLAKERALESEID